jgi:hypothetical protein
MRKAGRPPKDQWRRAIKAGADSEASLLTKRIRPALKRLGVSERQLAQAPVISPMLSLVEGGMKTILSAMRFAPDATISAFLAKYDSLSRTDQKDLPFEAIALACGINPCALLGSITLSLQMQSVSLVKLLALASHPSIVRARIKFGRLAGGDKDRMALDQAMGFLPNPKGPTFIGKAIYNTGADAMKQQRQRQLDGPDDDDEDDVPIAADGSYEYDLEKLFPPANKMQQELALIRQGLALPPVPGRKKARVQ